MLDYCDLVLLQKTYDTDILYKEFWECMDKYLKEQKFHKQYKKLCKKLKNKKVLVYGTGMLFQEVLKQYGLSDINIIGIADRKYYLNNDKTHDFGFKIIPNSQYSNVDADVILLGMQNYDGAIKDTKELFENKKSIPLVKMSFKTRILNIIKKCYKRKEKDATNVIILHKINGKKVINPKIKNLNVIFYGKNNTVELYEPITIYAPVNICCQNNTSVKIGAKIRLRETKFLLFDNSSIEIGTNNFIGNSRILSIGGKKITVGNDCLISFNVEIRNSDHHQIYDIGSNQLLNPAQDVIIGNHVWIAAHSLIFKGSVVPSNSIVGAHSLINKKFEQENSIYAGTPAKIVRQNIYWEE